MYFCLFYTDIAEKALSKNKQKKGKFFHDISKTIL